MASPSWHDRRLDELMTQYGAVPPPWFEYPDTHPYDIVWRMGDGESYIELFYTWWNLEKEVWVEVRRIEYFRRWPPPPRWLKHMIDCVWDIRHDTFEDEELFNYKPYFARTSELGFGSLDDYERDLAEFGQEDA